MGPTWRLGSKRPEAAGDVRWGTRRPRPAQANPGKSLTETVFAERPQVEILDILANNDIKVSVVMRSISVVWCGVVLAVCWAWPVQSQPVLFKDADLQLGQQLIATHRCEACHARRVGGDGSDIYNPAGRIKNASLLRGMVEYCNTELNLGMFPEEVTSVAAVINQRHYKFK